ncbi:MAG TPA: hypothetical protein VFP87_11690 [Chitinophagaceae bacterium]|nr:hypothetical protein [Chitinophagaceae bacterium]
MFRPSQSPYSAFANNPISNIDPSGADTINIIRKTTFDARKYKDPAYSSAGLDWMRPKLIAPGNSGITKTGSISVTASEGADVFRIVNLNTSIDQGGKETTISSSIKTLELDNPQTYYRSGGHNVKGYIDDRYALAANAPKWLLQYYANKNGDIGIKSAIAYQKDVPFAFGLNKIVSAAYLVGGAYGAARLTLSSLMLAPVEEESFFAGTRYTDKVMGQMKLGDFHFFPESVKAFERYGLRTTIKGADGVEREMLKIPGEYGNSRGYFEFIKEVDGSINHRVFSPTK